MSPAVDPRWLALMVRVRFAADKVCAAADEDTATTDRVNLLELGGALNTLDEYEADHREE